MPTHWQATQKKQSAVNISKKTPFFQWNIQTKGEVWRGPVVWQTECCTVPCLAFVFHHAEQAVIWHSISVGFVSVIAIERERGSTPISSESGDESKISFFLNTTLLRIYKTAVRGEPIKGERVRRLWMLWDNTHGIWAQTIQYGVNKKPPPPAPLQTLITGPCRHSASCTSLL